MRNQPIEWRFEAFRKTFDGAEGIYIEQGFHHVKVSRIELDKQRNYLRAWVTPLKTPGVYDETTLRPELRKGWRIGAGKYTKYSAKKWVVGYGGWQLYIDPEMTARVLKLAAEKEKEGYHYFARYKVVLDLLQKPGQWPPMEPFFGE